MNRDFANNVEAFAGDDGDSIDLRSFDAVLVTSTSDLAGVVEVSDEAAAGFVAIPAADLIVPEGGAEQNGAFVVGYRGGARYLRVTGDDAGAAVVVGYKLSQEPAGLAVESVVDNNA